MAEKRKRRISKCECCPYFAKNHEKGKWECSKSIFRKTGKFFDGDELQERVKACIFDSDRIISGDEEKAIIIERWIRANE